MRFSTNNIGAFLAVITGIVLIGSSAWPGAPQYTEYESAIWVEFSIIVGIGFVVAARDSRGIYRRSHLMPRGAENGVRRREAT